ncbi:Uncharacterized protein TCM_030982, partial [Theobroma cacao]
VQSRKFRFFLCYSVEFLMVRSCPIENCGRGETETDRISDLSDELLCRIISSLPLRETVRTSILSRRWKNLFTLISRLNIDDNDEPVKRYPLWIRGSCG